MQRGGSEIHRFTVLWTASKERGLSILRAMDDMVASDKSISSSLDINILARLHSFALSLATSN
jgi:hypothetical protein